MGKLYLKIFFLALPLLAVLGLYFCKDPFMVLHEYDRYDRSDVYLNENMVAWKMFKREQAYGKPFNAFVMGNSCTQAFLCSDWVKYLGPGAKAMRFFDNAETVGGVCSKLEAMDSHGADIRDVLLVLDWDSFRSALPMDGAMHLLPPDAASGDVFGYHLAYIQRFVNPSILVPYIRHLADSSYCSAGVVHNYGAIRDNSNNDPLNPLDRVIEKEGKAYWDRRVPSWGVYEESFAPAYVRKDVRACLERIRSIFAAHGTSYRILLGPDFRRVRINPSDLAALVEIFGEDNVFDFSDGEGISSDPTNYYNAGHYRPQVGRVLMERVYGGRRFRPDPCFF